jgi:tRNA (guanine-N7-)-methyltransferase
MGKPYLSLRALVPWRQLPRPLDWAGIFGRSAPLELEIGFGNGERLVRRARRHPERNLVGVEVSWPSVRLTLRKIHRLGLTNLRLVMAGAEVALARLFAPHSLVRVDALFPCPWPAPRHQRRRLFHHGFLRLLNSRMQTGAFFRMVTDHRGFFAWVLGQCADTGFLVAHRRRGPGVETKYERKWRAAGQEEFYELILCKQRHLEVPLPEEVALRRYVVRRLERGHLENRRFGDDPLVAFKDLVLDPERGRGLLRTVVVEEGFTQTLWLEFRAVEEGWRLRPAEGCGLVPTLGVRWALELASRLAEGRPPVGPPEQG